MISLAAIEPYLADISRELLLAIPYKNPAANKSPAAVVSMTLSTGTACTFIISLLDTIIDPFSPLVIAATKFFFSEFVIGVTTAAGVTCAAKLDVSATSGTATIYNGASTFVPTTDFHGTDQFTVTLTDAENFTYTQVITLTIT